MYFTIKTPEDVGIALKYFRLQKEFTMEEVSALVPISRNGYSYWENGKRMINTFALSRLSLLLNFQLNIKDGGIIMSNENNMQNLKVNIKEIEISTLSLNETIYNYSNDDILLLKKSILESGLVNPILISKGEDSYKVIDGNRRLAAIKELAAEGKYFSKTIPSKYVDKYEFSNLPEDFWELTDEEQLEIIILYSNRSKN